MAGAKETPRQKLIGLMYLVLLALLALQVDSAILAKFQFLDGSLVQARQNTVERNEEQKANIAEKVEERGKKPQEVAILNQAQEVRQRSQALIGQIEQMKEELIEKTGGRNDDGTLVGTKETEAIANIMIGPGSSKNGKAYDLKDELNTFAGYVNQVSGSNQFAKLALDGNEDPSVKNEQKHQNKDFATLNFSGTPLVAALAVLSDKQAKVANYEAAVLNELASKVGAADFKFDKLVPMHRAESRVVAAGTEYTADLFISATSSSLKPTMKFNGKDIQVDENGVGKVNFKASAAKYDKEGNAEKTWKAQIIMPNPTGGDTTIEYTGEYVVAKPVMQIQSASVQALYMNCGNDLNVQVPALGASYNPSFAVSGGSHINGSKKGEVIIVPNSKKVTMTLRSEGNTIGTQEFKVRAVPKPTVAAYVGNRLANIKSGENAPGPRSLTLRALPDDDFAAMLPKEARYAVVGAEIVLARGKRAIQTLNTSNPSINLTPIASKAQPGDRIVIEVERVVRKNFRDQIETVKMPATSSIITIPIN